MYRLVAFLIILAIILSARIYFYSQQPPKYLPSETVSISGIVWDDPQQFGRNQRVRLEGIVLIVPEYPQYQYGDNLSAIGMVEENTFVSKTGDTVTELVINRPHIQANQPPMFIRAAVWMRSRVITTFTSLLPRNEAALILGITLGVRSEFSKEMLDIFTQTGILHVVAASGSNVAIVAGVMLFSLQHVVTRKFSIVLTVFAIGWYAVLAGFDPAIIRASIMALITLSAQLLGRQNISYVVLLLTVWIMLMISPNMLTNVGFLLSVTATTGIITLKPLLDRVIKRIQILKEDITTTVAAQWGSMPILIGTFGSFAPLSTIVNLCVLWVVPIIMILGLLGSLTALIHPFIAVPFLYAAYPFAVYFLTVINIAKQVVFSVSFDSYSMYMTISYYMISLSIILILRPRNYVKK